MPKQFLPTTAQPYAANDATQDGNAKPTGTFRPFKIPKQATRAQRMAERDLGVAKASLAAGLLRQDPSSVSREEITEFHTLLDALLAQGSQSTIQKCKTWILTNTLPSAARVSGLGKYLNALSTSIGKTSTKCPTSERKQKLHILFLLGDVLHHTKYHDASPTAHSTVTTSLQPHIPGLVKAAASFPTTSNKKFHKRIHDLLNSWEGDGFFNAEYINRLRDIATRGAQASDREAEEAKQAAASAAQNRPATEEKPATEEEPSTAPEKEQPWILPATHGDPSTPWYDLPAGNMLPLMTPGSGEPIKTSLMRATPLKAGPADADLIDAVKNLLTEADRIYDPDKANDGLTVDYDQMGQPLMIDPATGKKKIRDTYYGWSEEWCDKMRAQRKEMKQLEKTKQQDEMRRRQEANDDSDGDGGPSRGRGRSSTPPKRHRYGSSASDHSRSPHRSRSRRHSDRSPTPPRSHSRYQRHSLSPPDHHRRHSRQDTSSRGSRSVSPDRPSFGQSRSGQQDRNDRNASWDAPYPPPPPPSSEPRMGYGPPPPIFPPYGMPPPPPPQGYSGPWPPPPPPHMAPNADPQGQFPPFGNPPMMPNFQNMPNMPNYSSGYPMPGGQNAPQGPPGGSPGNGGYQGGYHGGRGGRQGAYGRGRGRGRGR